MCVCSHRDEIATCVEGLIAFCPGDESDFIEIMSFVDASCSQYSTSHKACHTLP